MALEKQPGGYPSEKEPGGYPSAWFLEPELISKFGLECAICLSVMRKVVAPDCGHNFCEACFVALRDRRCPTCRADTKNTFRRVPSVDKMIAKLMVRCTNEGCAWKGDFGDMNAHEARCEFGCETCKDCNTNIKRRDFAQHASACPNRRVPCEGCGWTVHINSMPAHIADKCPAALVSCPECKMSVTRNRLSEHEQSECPIKCKSCGHIATRDMMQIHDADECPHKCATCDAVLRGALGRDRHKCPAVPRPCSYAAFGCPWHRTSGEMLRHLQDAAVCHESLLAAATRDMFASIRVLREAVDARGVLSYYIRNRPKKLRELLSAGVDVNRQDPQGNTPLRLAIESRNADSVRALLEAKADPNRVGEATYDSINHAARTDSVEIVRALLEHGATPGNISRYGKTYHDFTTNPQILAVLDLSRQRRLQEQ